MKKIITISREFGSGGRIIGETLAGRLGFDFYDKTLIEKVSEHSGFAPEYVQELEDLNETPSRLYQIAVKGYISKGLFGQNTVIDQHKVFGAQSKVIREIAAKGSCVIVGRASNYILRDIPDCLHVFVYAPLPDRLSRVVAQYGLEAETAERAVGLRDKARAGFYKQLSGDEWGSYKNYHLCIDTSYFGLDGAAGLILAGIE